MQSVLRKQDSSRHNDLCDFTAVCEDVDIEPQLLSVTGDTFDN